MSNNHLRLVADNSDQFHAMARFAHLSDSVWAHTSRERALADRWYLLLDAVKLDWVPRISEDVMRKFIRYTQWEEERDKVLEELEMIENRAKRIKSAILEFLQSNKCRQFATSSISGEAFSPIKDQLISLSTAIYLKWGELGELSLEWVELIQKNIRTAYQAIAAIIWQKIGSLENRESIESHLSQQWIRIFDETVTKLMLFEINQWKTDPSILILPAYHPYNPLVCAVKYDALFPGLRDALTLYSFLDELP